MVIVLHFMINCNYMGGLIYFGLEVKSNHEDIVNVLVGQLDNPEGISDGVDDHCLHLYLCFETNIIIITVIISLY